MVVEDHLELRQHLQNIISPKYNVLTASNGKEALRLLNRSLTPDSAILTPALIISDVMMPQMDGYTFLEKVKTKDQLCGIPFILLTARADVEDKLKGLRIGVDAYMTKPFEVEELLLRIKNLLLNAQNRNLSEEEPSSIPQGKKGKIANPPTRTYRPTQSDLEWLQRVETIALREIKNKAFKLEDVARELLISYISFRRKIKQITGLPPNRYIRSVRLHRAKQMLETQKINTLKEIAYEVGFDSSTYFSKLFETEFGKHPQEFLNKHTIIH